MKYFKIFIVILILMFMPNISSANVLIGDSGNWSNFTYASNVTTNPYNLIPAYSGDFFNRVNNTDLNANTGKTKWDEDTSGLQILDNRAARETYYGTMNDLNTSELSNYNISFVVSSTDGTDKKNSIYFYTNVSNFDELTSSTWNGEAYRLNVQADIGDIRFSYINGTETILDNFFGAADAINYGDVFSVDTSTVSTGLKVYINGELLDTMVSNSSISSGGVCFGSHSTLLVALDDYSVSFKNQENITSNIQTLSANLTGIKLHLEGGTSADVWVNTSMDEITWTGNILVKEDALNGVEYAVNSSNEHINVITTVLLKTVEGIKTELSSVYILDAQISSAPTFTYTSANITSYENEVDTFTANSSQTVNVSWLVNGVELDTNTSVTSFSYSNSTALNGTAHNITALISNTNGSAQYSWEQLKLLNSVDIFITYEDRANTSYNIIWNVSNITAGLQHWNVSWNGTDNGNTYNFNYWNGTNILSQTATSDNQTLWFNSSVLLEEGKYYISETVSGSTMIIPANSWGMFNNWTSTMTFAGIAANESNDICYSYYNVITGLWESYYVGYSWNADYQLSKDASVMAYFNAQTDITFNIIIPSSTELYEGWNMLALQNSSNQTINDITVESISADRWVRFEDIDGTNRGISPYNITASGTQTIIFNRTFAGNTGTDEINAIYDTGFGFYYNQLFERIDIGLGVGEPGYENILNISSDVSYEITIDFNWTASTANLIVTGVEGEIRWASFEGTPSNTTFFTFGGTGFIDNYNDEIVNENFNSYAIDDNIWNGVIDDDAPNINVYTFNSTAGIYTNASNQNVQPNQGILLYTDKNYSWSRVM